MLVVKNNKMNFEECFDYLNNFTNYEKKAHLLKPRFSLAAIKKLLKLMGNPQNKYPTVHVAGTVGKGSVCNMVERVLRESGYRTGLYISPHFVDVRERIALSGTMISKENFVLSVEKLREIVGDNFDELTYFEMMTALAFDYFAREEVDVAVIEVGLGGRLDATNVLNPQVSVITRLGWDHVKVLGPRLSDIAAEKAGIIKRGAAVVTTEQKPAAAEVIEKTCKKLRSELRVAEKEKWFTHVGPAPGGEIFDINLGRHDPERVKLPLSGSFQAENLAVALETIEALRERGFLCKPDSIKNGLEKVVFPGRMELVHRRGRPCVMLDGAHNQPAARALADSLNNRSSFKNPVDTFIVGMMKDKDCVAVLKELSACGDRIILITLPHDRAMPAPNLKKLAAAHFKYVTTAPDMCAALVTASGDKSSKCLICVTGSLYAVAEAKISLRKRRRCVPTGNQ